MVLGAGWLLTLTASHNWAAWGGRGYTGQGAPSLHSQRQRIPATTTAVPTRLLTRCPQNMLKTPKYAHNSKMYQNIKMCPTPQYNLSKIRAQGQLTNSSTSRRSIGTLRSQTLGKHHMISGPTIAYTRSKEQPKTKIHQK